jgi:hypothetical protein
VCRYLRRYVRTLMDRMIGAPGAPWRTMAHQAHQARQALQAQQAHLADQAQQALHPQSYPFQNRCYDVVCVCFLPVGSKYSTASPRERCQRCHQLNHMMKASPAAAAAAALKAVLTFLKPSRLGRKARTPLSLQGGCQIRARTICYVDQAVSLILPL